MRAIDSRAPYNASDLVRDEIRRLVLIRALKQEIVLQGPAKDRQHHIAASFHAPVSTGFAPHLDSICKKSIFRRRLFILSICGLEKALGPGMSVVPVKIS